MNTAFVNAQEYTTVLALVLGAVIFYSVEAIGRWLVSKIKSVPQASPGTTARSVPTPSRVAPEPASAPAPTPTEPLLRQCWHGRCVTDPWQSVVLAPLGADKFYVIEQTSPTDKTQRNGFIARDPTRVGEKLTGILVCAKTGNRRGNWTLSPLDNDWELELCEKVDRVYPLLGTV